jgi:Domain of unknown function (DUF4365)
MSRITENIRKGNWGVSFVSHKLSKNCLVRPVLEGTDIGIDLYCESFDEKGNPFQHFWVQVKCGDERIKIAKDNSYAYYSFKREHLYYWSKQPIPVFVFLVPYKLNYDKENYIIYVVDITDQVHRLDILKTNKPTTLNSNLKIENDNNLSEFIFNHVPYSSAVQKISYGIVSFIPSIKPSYMKSRPIGLVKNHVDKILNSIRTTSTFAFQELSILIDDVSLDSKILKLKNILEVFKDDLKFEIPYTLGLFEYINYNFDSAISYFRSSIEIIDKDPNSKNEPALQRWKDIINGMIEVAEKRNTNKS